MATTKRVIGITEGEPIPYNAKFLNETGKFKMPDESVMVVFYFEVSDKEFEEITKARTEEFERRKARELIMSGSK